MKTIAFTGHRPPKTGLTYKDSLFNNSVKLFIQNLLNKELSKDKLTVITGGALGIDQLAAWAALDAQSSKQIIAEPFIGFNSKWPEKSIKQYEVLKKQSGAEIVTVCEPRYDPKKMQLRNQWMCDHADEVWAWWDGTSGGTKNCVQYAIGKGKPIRNLYKEFCGKI